MHRQESKFYLGLSIALVVFLYYKIVKPKTMKAIFESTFLGKYDKLRPLLFAQAVHETGNFTSRAFKEQNNMFGMKVPFRRPFIGEKSQSSMYASYTNPKQSLEDLIIYLNFVNFPNNIETPEEFARELKIRSYFEDNVFNYINGLKNGLQIYNRS